MILRLPGTHNSVLTLERAFADSWAYDPKYLDVVTHPSRAFYADCDYLHVHDVRARTLKLVLPKLRTLAEEVLSDLDVKHLEVQVVTVEADQSHSGYHLRSKCPACDWLYYTDYSDGYLVGWYAVVRGQRGDG